jgi:hypothetical protein
MANPAKATKEGFGGEIDPKQTPALNEGKRSLSGKGTIGDFLGMPWQ